MLIGTIVPIGKIIDCGSRLAGAKQVRIDVNAKTATVMYDASITPLLGTLRIRRARS